MFYIYIYINIYIYLCIHINKPGHLLILKYLVFRRFINSFKNKKMEMFSDHDRLFISLDWKSYVLQK